MFLLTLKKKKKLIFHKTMDFIRNRDLCQITKANSNYNGACQGRTNLPDITCFSIMTTTELKYDRK